MDPRPRILWRRRSLFVAVVIAVIIGSTVSVFAATGSSSPQRYYACVAGPHKTLNLIATEATCPRGQRKISLAAGTGSKGATGPAGPTGSAGQTGPEGKAGATGAQGKAGAAGAEGKQGPEGKEGSAGPPGSEGKEGKEGKQGNEGPRGPTGGSTVYAAASGDAVTPTTLVNGLPGNVVVLPLQGDRAETGQVFGGVLNQAGGPGQVVPAQTFPVNQKIESITVFMSTTSAQTLIGTTVTVRAQLYISSTPDNTFTAVPAASVTAAPALTGIVGIGTISNGITSGLSIPIAAQTRGVIVVSIEASGVSGVNSVPMYVSASLSAG